MPEWKIVERPGYFGKKREEIFNSWNESYGNDNWKLAWQWGNNIVPKDMAIQLYEDAYYEFFKRNTNTLDWLINTASDVYDTAISNVQAGLDYSIQETPNTHIHDVSIRRAVLRLGEQFRGDHLMHVRWKDSEGYKINPGVVPFHMRDMINAQEINDYSGSGMWWLPNSIEDFYQKNKVLLAKK